MHLQKQSLDYKILIRTGRQINILLPLQVVVIVTTHANQIGLRAGLLALLHTNARQVDVLPPHREDSRGQEDHSHPRKYSIGGPIRQARSVHAYRSQDEHDEQNNETHDHGHNLYGFLRALPLVHVGHLQHHLLLAPYALYLHFVGDVGRELLQEALLVAEQVALAQGQAVAGGEPSAAGEADLADGLLPLLGDELDALFLLEAGHLLGNINYIIQVAALSQHYN